MHFIKIKTFHVLHKLSFHNTIRHRSHSLLHCRPCYSRHLINSLLCCTYPLWNYYFLVVENHCVFLAHIFWNCAFSQKCAWKMQNADKKLSLEPTKLNDFTVDNSLEAIQSRNEANHPTALIGWECIFTVEIGSNFFPSAVESFIRGDDAVRSKILTVPANCIINSYKYIILGAMHDLTNDYNANKMLYSLTYI